MWLWPSSTRASAARPQSASATSREAEELLARFRAQLGREGRAATELRYTGVLQGFLTALERPPTALGPGEIDAYLESWQERFRPFLRTSKRSSISPLHTPRDRFYVASSRISTPGADGFTRRAKPSLNWLNTTSQLCPLIRSGPGA